MYSKLDHPLTGLLKCLVIVIVGNNIISNSCFAQPLNQNKIVSQVAKLEATRENSKPRILTKGEFYN